MARLDNAMQKTVVEMLKDARDVEIYSISAFVGGSEITRCLNDVKTVLIRNKGKDVTVVVGVR
jgi:hypothetical protein